MALKIETPSVEQLLKRNEDYSQNHKPMPLIKEIVASGGGPPKICVITCVDPRLCPENLLGLGVGEAFVFRTVAGHPQTTVEDIAAVSIQGHDCVEEVMIIHHTDCGTLQFNVPRIRSAWVQRDPSSMSQIDKKTFGVQEAYGYRDQEHALREDVEWLKSQLLMYNAPKSINVRGYIYDLKSGKLREDV